MAKRAAADAAGAEAARSELLGAQEALSEAEGAAAAAGAARDGVATELAEARREAEEMRQDADMSRTRPSEERARAAEAEVAAGRRERESLETRVAAPTLAAATRAAPALVPAPAPPHVAPSLRHLSFDLEAEVTGDFFDEQHAALGLTPTVSAAGSAAGSAAASATASAAASPPSSAASSDRSSAGDRDVASPAVAQQACNPPLLPPPPAPQSTRRMVEDMRAQLARVASRVEEERWAEEEEEDASWSEVGQAAKDPELREAEEAAAAAAALAASDPSVRLEAEAAAKKRAAKLAPSGARCEAALPSAPSAAANGGSNGGAAPPPRALDRPHQAADIAVAVRVRSERVQVAGPPAGGLAGPHGQGAQGLERARGPRGWRLGRQVGPAASPRQGHPGGHRGQVCERARAAGRVPAEAGWDD